MAPGDQNVLATTQLILDFSYLALLLFADAVLFIKVRLNLDKAAIITLVSQLIVIFLRALKHSIPESTDDYYLAFIMIIGFCNNAIWATLFYFVFEMQIIHLKLTINKPIEFLRRQKNINITKIAVLGLTLVYSSAISVLMGIQFGSPHIYKENEDLFDNAQISLRVVKFSLDIYIFSLFFYLMLYFIKAKREILYYNDFNGFSYYNIFIISWAYFLFILNIFHSLLAITQSSLNFTSLSKDVLVNVFVIGGASFFIPFKDFLTSITLCYLFLYQGLKNRNSSIHDFHSLVRKNGASMSVNGTNRIDQYLETPAFNQFTNEAQDEELEFSAKSKKKLYQFPQIEDDLESSRFSEANSLMHSHNRDFNQFQRFFIDQLNNH
ncbi:hypothetical protein FGO68_gene13180 [Halteria grandinella]|uniref:Transmembrane protein n=1 Tax=Halteria grandinella TaxID=5974 RepID=A0A8J8NLJ3_HALGN|nr:hypothetical protein FGO68_gene13180 [Halteria grandinella]